MATTPVVHDHIVLLLSNEDFENPPFWLTSNFTIIPGGTHAGGSSRNKLVIFQDGTYLELFTWIGAPAEFLAWASKPPGLIDFALTTLYPLSAEENHSTVSSALSRIPAESSLGVTYQDPIPGGRKRADGVEVKWKGSRPDFARVERTPGDEWFPNGRIDVPFFCHDVTARTVRVPFDDEAVTSHPCGAVGIESVEVAVPREYLKEYVRLYSAVLGVGEPEWRSDGRRAWEGAWFPVGVPREVGEREAYVIVYPSLGGEMGEKDRGFFMERGIGIRSVTFRTGGGVNDGLDAVSLASEGIGASVLICR